MKRKASTSIDFGSDESSAAENEASVPETSAVAITPPEYKVEMSKSGRAECRKCDTKIAMDVVRVGVTTEGDWGPLTRWQHLHCTIFHSSITDASTLEGYASLPVSVQEEVDARVEQSKHEVDPDFVPLNEDDLVRTQWETPVDAPPTLLMPLLPYQKEGLGWMLHQVAQCKVLMNLHVMQLGIAIDCTWRNIG